MARIRKDDLVKIISGKDKGTVGKVLSVNAKDNTVVIDGVGLRQRNIRPTKFNPQGGKKDIHVAIDVSKVALVVDEKSTKTSRVGIAFDNDGNKIRVARQLKNKEIK